MRNIPEEMADRIESGAATLCHVWRLERADGAVMGFTDHDRDLVVDGVVCRAASGWTAGAGESAVGLAAGSVSAAGALDDEAISEADVAAGLFDAATVELWRVDWARPDLRVRLWSEALARIKREGGSLGPARQVGPRLETLKVQGTAEESPMACVFGRARVTGQVIWAARFLEGKNKGRAGKGGPKTVDYVYSLSFAVALCEGEIDGVGRVWADGRLMDMTGVVMRVHRGGEDQTPDPLIEAVEGAAPAYRGTAYVVFEDLPLGPFGDRVPQLSFEAFRRPRGQAARLEDLLEGVCLIPGAGEFALATEAVVRRDGLTRTAAENVHNGEGRADLMVSLDQLQAQLPKLKRVSLVVGWFGSDLRAGVCRVRPGVERRNKPTEPMVWSVARVAREDAYEVSQVDGAPAYGGTPSDESVRQAIRELKARGLEVTLYPFVFMDAPAIRGGGVWRVWKGRGRRRRSRRCSAGPRIGACGGWRCTTPESRPRRGRTGC